MKQNVIIAQSGGPTAVINNTLRGIIEALEDYPDRIGSIYGGWHGIEGVLAEELIDLSAQDRTEIALLRTTPSAGSIGTCRYKLKNGQKEDFSRIIDVFRAHNIGYFFYIGGNDSQHTAMRVSELARTAGIGLVATGVPKTIDNDLGDNEFRLIDHTPGYGSVARYWAHIVQNANQENAGSCTADPVLVLQAMGRKIGYIPAASRLADPDREMPLLIFMTESKLGLAGLHDRVNECLSQHGRCIVVVSEGFEAGDLGAVRDAFGHESFGSSRGTVCQTVVNHLNARGLAVRGQARGQVMGTDQRNAIAYASSVDLDEAYGVGRTAVEIAMKHGTGFMATILREPGTPYRVRYDMVPLAKVALSERVFPEQWITRDRTDVTDDFVAYAAPLAGTDRVEIPFERGLQRFTRFKRIFAEKKLGPYVPVAFRT